MADQRTLDEIKPTKKEVVFDLVQSAGFDITDWIESSNDSRGHKANPKYCYEWSFVEPEKVVILNLWHDMMAIEDGVIIERANFRTDAKSHQGKANRGAWFRRATKIDEALQVALRENLPVRVIINDGIKRERGVDDPVASRVTARQLDPEPWTITQYDWTTGEHTISRGILSRKFIDQFDLDQAKKVAPDKVEKSGSIYVRDPKVRAAVRVRANGRCEYCGEAGFKTESGAIYIETHHIVPLSEDGEDTETNVIGLCPNDHRRAHFQLGSISLRDPMIEIVRSRLHG